MNHFSLFLRTLFGSLLLLLLTPAHAQQLALNDVDFIELGNNRVLMTLILSGPAPQPSAFSVDKPARLSLDLPDTRTALPERYKRLNIGNVRGLANAQAQGRTRVVVELGEAAPYSMEVAGNRILVRLESPARSLPQPSVPSVIARAPPPTASATAAAPRGAATLGALDFRRGEKGEGRLSARISDPNTVVDVREDSGKIIASLRNTRLDQGGDRRLDVLDFATPVQTVDVREVGLDTQLIITPVSGQEFEHAAYQSGNRFTLELQPVTAETLAARKAAQPEFTGERISLSFQSVDIRSLLQIVADVAGTNMVISDSVTGQIAMRLENVPWDQALDIILKTKGLGMRQQGNVMLVAPAQELAEREQRELEAIRQRSDLAPVRSEIIQVNYAKAADLKALISSGDMSMLSERGRISVDERTNTLLVLETRDKIDEIRGLVARLDIPVRQVLIESRIVIANDDFIKEIGARFGVGSIGRSGSTTIGQSGGAADPQANNSGGGGGSGGGTGGQQNQSLGNLGSRAILGGQLPSAADNYIFNMPSFAAGSSGIGWTILGKNFLIDLELTALQQEGRGEVVSTPKVLTQNGKQATIKHGFEVPYETVSQNGTNVEFKEALLQLEVTPNVNPNNTVSMDLLVTKDEPDFTRAVKGTPALNKRELQTSVQVTSGETVVLGGTFETQKANSSSKVPLLGDIPLIGRLFRNNRSQNTKQELLIFVTPRVLQEGINVE
ncbi:type IV pilus secretin family protein [Sinimarinibacterium sp. NLF-5-8]|uniref:type IV pilus secretin family protein n=1 Tax=Sinimarinibacterium sp. NLF-5-8 TaxID=2698684 RepID=UPI00137C3EDC|nr:type IV pilus secretin family protein [Sinimarinibacterium sp. NLF-5-8]QHS10783.1 type IV pilus secretin PilQ [Sinimarinibacterium sp. NLF-5-8]